MSFFYNATIKPPTALAKSFRCNFTVTGDVPDINLVTVCSSTVNVYTLQDHSIELKANSQFNDKIVECIAIPVPAQRFSRKREIESALETRLDLIFVLTQNFNCALVYFNRETQQIEVISRGNLSEKGTGEKREGPFPIFVAADSKFITLMLYDNVIKVIPLVAKPESQFPLQLSNAINLRVRHADVTDVIPLQCDNSKDPVFAVLYQKIEHSIVNQRPVKRVKREIEKIYYDQAKGDLVSKSEKLTLQSNTIYKIVYLEFGGMLAFDIDQIAYCSSDLKQPLIYRKLRTPLKVTAVCQVDYYDVLTGKTKEGTTFMRYLLATEAGELFMLAFQLELLDKPDQEQRFIVLEFLASELSSASSVTYLDNSYVFYASAHSDSYILQVTSELQPDFKRPFCKIIQTFESLAPIVDMTLATPNNAQGGQSELLITSGLNHATYMSLIKKGIQLNPEYQFELGKVQSVFTAGNYAVIQLYQYDQPIWLEVGQTWEGRDLGVAYKGDIIGLKQHDTSYIIITTQQIQAYTNWELTHSLDTAIELFTSSDYITVSNQNQITILEYDLTQINQFQFDSAVSALCSNSQLIYVCLFDAPFYTVNVLSKDKKIHSVALAQFMDISLVRRFFNQKYIVEDRVFTNEAVPSTESVQVTTQYESSACVSIEHIQVNDVDTLICGFKNGKILQLSYLVGAVVQTTDLQQAEFAVNCANADELGVAHGQGESAFFGPEIYFVGTVAPIMSRVNGAIICATDKPVIFYASKDKIEMQYLSAGQIRKVCQVQDKMMYIDCDNQLNIGSLDDLQKLQIHRMLFKKQITKSLLLPKFDSIVVLLEEPDLAYIDESKNVVNLVGLVSRSTIQAQKIFKLNRTEVPNCIYHNEHTPGLDLIMIGTCYLKLDEIVPSAGRLLLLDPKTLLLVQEFAVDGSVQSITYDGKVLSLAVNNRIKIHSFTATKQRDIPFAIEIQDQKQTGTFIHSLTQLGSGCLIVADMAGSGICTYDLVQQRHGKVKLSEAASSHISLWTNQVVAISDSQFLVFDQSNNMIIFEKHPAPVTLEQKYKLTVVGSFCLNEEVKSAAFGSLKLARKESPAVPKLDQKRMHYVSAPLIKEADVEMTECQMVFDDKFDLLIRTDLQFTKAKYQQALGMIENYNQQQIMYGTSEGSIGTLFRLPQLVFYILNQLQQTMDKLVLQDLTMVKRSEYRKVQLLALDSTSQAVIDGDFVEQFMLLPKAKQLDVVKRMVTGQVKGDETLQSLLLQILQGLTKHH